MAPKWRLVWWIKTNRLGGKEDIAPEPASDQRDTVKDTELIVSVLNGDIDRVHRMVLAALGWPLSSSRRSR